MHLPVRLILLLALVVAAALPASAPAAKRSVPQDWLGVVADVELEKTPDYLVGEFGRMAAAGVETVRTPVYWREVQPYRRMADVPPEQRGQFRDVGGVPTDFETFDRFVGLAAKRRLTILPTVLGAPAWASLRPFDPASTPSPEGTRAYAALMTTLIRRYGPRGSFWRRNPRLPKTPIRAWQVWNEPNVPFYWSEQPFAKTYVALLRRANRAIQKADRRALTVLPGLPNDSPTAMRALYKAGIRGHFDVAAVHPYTAKPANVVRLIETIRSIMARNGDRRRELWVTELSWPASEGRPVEDNIGLETTDRGQATRLRDGVRRLAAARKRLRIGKLYWYTWVSNDQNGQAGGMFFYSGLRRIRGTTVVDAPALRAYRSEARRLQGCRKGSGSADRCAG